MYMVTSGTLAAPISRKEANLFDAHSDTCRPTSTSYKPREIARGICTGCGHWVHESPISQAWSSMTISATSDENLSPHMPLSSGAEVLVVLWPANYHGSVTPGRRPPRSRVAQLY
jgi:hypothetical protein